MIKNPEMECEAIMWQTQIRQCSWHMNDNIVILLHLLGQFTSSTFQSAAKEPCEAPVWNEISQLLWTSCATRLLLRFNVYIINQ